MRVENFFSPDTTNMPKSITVGMFDGVHTGHQSLINQTIQEAKKRNSLATVVTFREHPQKMLTGKGPDSISSFDYKLKLMAETGLDLCLWIDFSHEVAQITPEDFLYRHLVANHKMTNIVVGSNFRFGAKAAGDVTMLEQLQREYKYNFTPAVLERHEEAIISSSYIREVVKKSNMILAAKLLGRTFTLHGKVVTGKQRGRELGFPTANLQLYHSLIPPEGVYFGYCSRNNQEYTALISIGNAPTFSDVNQVIVEAHLVGFKGDLYSQDLEVTIQDKIRDQFKFNNVQELCLQMEKDRDYALSQTKSL